MKLVRTKRALRDQLLPARAAGRSVGLVPTMGYLHDGHLSLLRAARDRCELVVMTSFVNPAQFRSDEDLASYPRDEERDAGLAATAGVDLLYAPPTSEVYADGHATSVIVDGITEVLCGDPGRRGTEHFRGVTTVVAKLFNTVQPDVAFFGQKDAQQAIVIERMVRDLDFPVEIVVMPTIREQDGLAMSSRNSHLSPDERRRATALNQALEAVRERAEGGAGIHPPQWALSERLADHLAAAGGTGGEPSQVPGHPGDAVGIVAAKIRIDDDARDALGVLGRHAGALEALPHQRGEVGAGDRDRQPRAPGATASARLPRAPRVRRRCRTAACRPTRSRTRRAGRRRGTRARDPCAREAGRAARR